MIPTNEGTVYEGLQVSLRPAPFWKRFFAYATDIALVSCVIYIIAIAFILTTGTGVLVTKALTPNADKGIAIEALVFVLVALLVILFFYHGYFIYFESKKGYTPGKKLFGLIVISSKGGKLTLGQCVLRDMMRYVDCGLILPGLLSIILSEKAQRLGDLMAGTLVVHSAHEEQTSNFLYMKQEEFLLLKEAWAPTVVPPDVSKKYLEFAYPTFCQGRKPSSFDVEKWQDISLNYIHPKTPDPIGQQTLLLFFAELCFQTYSELKKGAQRD